MKTEILVVLASAHLLSGTARAFDAYRQDGGWQFRVRPGGPTTIFLNRIDNPPISQPLYALTGQLKYDAVEGDGYLELWSFFPNSGPYFSRTLAGAGGLRKITGTSDWRNFVLPFDSQGAKGNPTRLEFNLVLPKGGNVTLREVKLVQFPAHTTIQQALLQPGVVLQSVEIFPTGASKGLSPASNAWWDERSGAWLGGIGGTLLGLLGAVMGITARKHRHMAIRCGLGASAAGLLLLLAGLIALVLRQPYAVYYPLLLGGFIASAVFGANTIQLVRRTRQEELQRISALDA